MTLSELVYLLGHRGQRLEVVAVDLRAGDQPEQRRTGPPTTRSLGNSGVLRPLVMRYSAPGAPHLIPGRGRRRSVGTWPSPCITEPATAQREVVGDAAIDECR